MKYYRLIINSYEKTAGVLHAPETWPYPIARDTEEVKNWQSLVIELRDGIYCPFNICCGANIVSQELKDMFCSFVDLDAGLEFLPVKVVSKEYGDRTCYIMHFTKIHDVIDYENCERFGDTILKIALDYRKVKGLKVFNSRPVINDVIVSEDVRKAMKKTKLSFGSIFSQIKLTHEDDL